MAILHRKILFAQQILSPDPYNPPQFDTDDFNSCYNCYYGCPAYCYQFQYFPPPAPEPETQSKHEISTTLIIMLCLLGAAFVVLSYLTVTRYRLNRNRRDSLTLDGDDGFRQDRDEHATDDHHVWYIRTVGLTQSVIDSIAVFRYKKGEQLVEGSDCSVCLVEFGEDECLRLLPKCSHAFHVDCIDTWLRSHRNCPVCRAPVLATSNTRTEEASIVEMRSSDLATTQEDEAVENEIESSDEVENEIMSKNGYLLDKRMSRGIRVSSDLSVRGVQFDAELFQQSRRSVSVDFGYASMLSVKRGKGRSFTNLERLGKGNGKTSVYRLTKCSSSHGNSLQRVPVLMKRSFSCSAKRSQRKHSRTLESLLALD